MENNTIVRFNLHEGSFDISGSENFVEKMVPLILSFIDDKKNIVVENKEASNDFVQKQENKSVEKAESNVTTIDKYIKSGVYHVDAEDGSISILQTVPGTTKAEKARNIALIVLHVKQSKIEGKSIIPICEKHNCYDGANFSTWFKSEKTNVIRKGSGQSWTLELTQPGEQTAIALLEGMVNASAK